MLRIRNKLMFIIEVFMKENSTGRGIVILAASSIILKLLSALFIPILSSILNDEGIAIYTNIAAR